MVAHPQASAHGGYNEIQQPPSRDRIIDLNPLAEDRAARHPQWSESIAVASERLTQGLKERLGISATHREVVREEDSYALREPLTPCTGDVGGEMVLPGSENRPFCNADVEVSDAWRGPTRAGGHSESCRLCMDLVLIKLKWYRDTIAACVVAGPVMRAFCLADFVPL